MTRKRGRRGGEKEREAEVPCAKFPSSRTSASPDHFPPSLGSPYRQHPMSAVVSTHVRRVWVSRAVIEPSVSVGTDVVYLATHEDVKGMV